MAVSKTYIIQLGRLIVRLRDPYPLSAVEQKKLNDLLPSFEEQEEVERRYIEIKRGREFMTLPVCHPGWYFYENRKELTESIRDAVRLAKHDTSIALKRIAKCEAEIRVIERQNYRNGAILASAQAELAKWEKIRDGYVDSVRLRWEATPDEVRRRFFDHRGSFSLGNLPKLQPDWERLFWPDEPSNRRQANIEVIQLKIDRLSTEH